MNEETPRYSMSELCQLTDMSLRTVRFYIQRGLLDRPEGEKRGAWYTTRHLEQLLEIRKWTAAGLSLEAITRLRDGQGEPPPVRPQPVGSIEVRSHLLVAEGVEVVVSPQRAHLSPEQLRHFLRQVGEVYQNIMEQQK